MCVVKIEKLNHQAEGIAKLDDKVIFVPNSYIGETVEINIDKEHKNYLEGHVCKYIDKSVDRLDYKCPYYNECGGCNILHLNYKKQLEFKKNKVIDIFKKYVDMEINPDICGSDNILNYRNKVTFHVKDGQVGFYKEGSHNLIKIDECLLITDKMNNILKYIKKNVNLSKVDKIMLRDTGIHTMVVFYGKKDELKIDKSLMDMVDSIYLNDKLIYGIDKCEVKLSNYRFVVSPEAFFQVNVNVMKKLYDKIKEYIGGDMVKYGLDLYCGTGTISIYVSDLCEKMLGIEINKSAIDDANYNKKINNKNNIEYMVGDVSNLINDKMNPDLIIVDPPRKGLDKKTIEVLKKIKCKNIIYVSCDPMTLARDINLLNKDYKLIDITLFDMFPETYHVESVVKLIHNN